AASGISAAYNAPIAGAIFAALVVLGNFSMNLFAPLVFASVVASVVSRSFFGIQPRYAVPPFDITSITQLPWFLLLGMLSGLLALAGLILAKMIATGATIGSGAVGGVFTPTLFLGAGLGSAFGMALHQVGEAQALPATAFGLVGMGAVLAATTHSPLLAVILV